MSDKKKAKFFYGYVIVAAGLLASVFMISAFSAFGVFFKPLSSEFGWTRAMTSAAVSIATIVMGFSCLVNGRLTDKYGPRIVLMGCGFLMGAGLLLVSRVSALWQLYLFYGLLVGSGMSAADVTITATVVRWFVKRRGMMAGITKVGAGIGIMVGSLWANWLISNYGWRPAYAILGGTILVGVISVALFFKRDPSQIGALPDGATELPVTGSKANPCQFSLREAMSTRQFRLFAIIWFSFMFCIQLVIVHIVPHATDLGISATIAATILSVIGGFSILGRLGLTSLSDILGTKKAYMIAFSLLVTAFIWLQFTRETWMFYLFAALYGTAHGASFALLSPMMAGLFGLGSLATILGVILFVGTFGSLISPMLAGWIFDIMGSYQLAFGIALVLSSIGLLLVSQLKPTGSKGGDND